jgi:ABC-2 type transport system ATP-binding protein
MDLMIKPAVQIEHLFYRHQGQSLSFFNDLSLEISSGERFGLFGPNGAGKTTLMYLMTGVHRFDQGAMHILGHQVKPPRKLANTLFGFVPQDFAFYEELSPAENLEFFGSWAGLDRKQIRQRTAELLAILGLSEFRNKSVRNFSGGMKRRVNLAIGVIHQPRILFLDEPTVGVDVQTRYAIIDYLKQINETNGTTLVYTSHQLNEAEDLCKQIALIDQGKILAHDKLDSLLAKHSQEGLEGLFLSLTGKAYRD